MDSQEIARLRALLAKATAAPWNVTYDYGRITAWVEEALWDSGPDSGPWLKIPDAELIAAARNALPGLLDEIERLRRVVEAASVIDFGRYAEDAKIQAVLTALAALDAEAPEPLLDWS